MRLSEAPSAQYRKEDVVKSQKAQKSKSSRPGLPFSLSLPADLQSKAQKLQLAIARRAHELFEARGREHGHDLEDWLRAESELQCPVSIAMSESNNRVSVRADVAGFDQSEIEVSVEPSRVIILGKKTQSRGTTEPGTTEPRGSHPDQIVEVIDLATEVIPERAIVKLREGELILELPAASKNKTAA
jgi:HSP20 family molecular chaperone IbpA